MNRPVMLLRVFIGIAVVIVAAYIARVKEKDRKTRYTSDNIKLIVFENTIRIPYKKYKEKYNKTIEQLFQPGSIVACKEVETGYIRIKERLEDFEGNTIKYYQYSYKVYNPKIDND